MYDVKIVYAISAQISKKELLRMLGQQFEKCYDGWSVSSDELSYYFYNISPQMVELMKGRLANHYARRVEIKETPISLKKRITNMISKLK